MLVCFDVLFTCECGFNSLAGELILFWGMGVEFRDIVPGKWNISWAQLLWLEMALFCKKSITQYRKTNVWVTLQKFHITYTLLQDNYNSCISIVNHVAPHCNLEAFSDPCCSPFCRSTRFQRVTKIVYKRLQI